MTFEKLCEYAKECEIDFTITYDDEDNPEGAIIIYSCAIGENFYDYGEDAPMNWTFLIFPIQKKDCGKLL